VNFELVLLFLGFVALFLAGCAWLDSHGWLYNQPAGLVAAGKHVLTVLSEPVATAKPPRDFNESSFWRVSPTR